jgi:hypothetical protein
MRKWCTAWSGNLVWWPLVLAVLLVAGCGTPKGSISGKVTYKGQPLTSGTVTFLGSDNSVATSPIDAEGNYSIAKVAAGPAKITVRPGAAGTMDPRMKGMDPSKMGGAPEGKGGEKGGAAPAKVVKIPDKYSDSDKTPLSYTVTAGAQTHDIKLE